MATHNRLKLDFSLSTNAERAEFLQNYLAQEPFITRPPTEDELEMMGNYLLWGKDPATGLNAQQEGLLTIDTKHGTWDKDSNIDSLDGLMEQPTFNEACIHPLDAVPYKVKREVFSRKEALTNCPESLRQTLVDLFRRIDEIDLAINYYDLAHGKRINPPREELLRTFTAAEQEELQQWSSKWNQYTYLKQRHLLVELRREQYVIRDSFKQTLLVEQDIVVPAAPPEINAEIEVLPLGVVGTTYCAAKLFRDWNSLIPANYTEEDLKEISDFYWKKQNYKPAANQFYIDFRELEHVYQLFLSFFDLEDAADGADVRLESNLRQLLDTLVFYIERAELTDLQKEILDMKMKKVRNTEIAATVNKKWCKNYTPNYISTIFRQRIIPKINEAAAFHVKIVSNIFFEEEFKACTCCGKVFLRCPENFTKNSRAKDGLVARCKACEKAARK